MKLIATPHALLQSLLLPCCGASAGARGRDAQVLANAVDSDIFGREHPAELFLARVRATHKVGFHFLREGRCPAPLSSWRSALETSSAFLAARRAEEDSQSTDISSIHRSAPTTVRIASTLWQGAARATLERAGAAGQPAMRPLCGMDSRSSALRARKNPGTSVGMHDPQQHSGGKTPPLGFTDELLVFNALVEGSEIQKDSDAMAVLVSRPLKLHHSLKTDVKCSTTRKRSIVPKQVPGFPDPILHKAPTQPREHFMKGAHQSYRSFNLLVFWQHNDDAEAPLVRADPLHL